MKPISSALFLFMILPADDKPAPKLPLGKETTYVTGPLDKEGYIDYDAALNEQLGKGINPEKNANVLIWRAIGPRPEGVTMPAEYFRALGIAEPPLKGEYFVDLRDYILNRRHLGQEEWTSHSDNIRQLSTRIWKGADFPLISDWLKTNEKPLAILIEATQRSDYFNPLIAPRNEFARGVLINALMPNVQLCRYLVAALSSRAMLRVGDGQFDLAWQDLLACHRLGRLVSRGSTPIESLVGIAICAVATEATVSYLERAPLTSPQVLERLKELTALPPFAPLGDKIAWLERFVYLDLIQYLRRYGPDNLEQVTTGKLPTKPSDRPFLAMDKIDFEPALRDGNRRYDRLAAAVRIRDRKSREKEFQAIDTEMRALKAQIGDDNDLRKLIHEGATRIDRIVGKKIGEIFVTLFLPNFPKIQQAYDRAAQLDRNLHVAFALAAFRRDTGRFPEKLSELAPKYLPEIPDDLFSSQPIVYRVTHLGYTLYSVGPNGVDDDGRSVDGDPPGDDLLIEMPMPAVKAKTVRPRPPP